MALPEDMVSFIIVRGRWRSGESLVWNDGLAVPVHPRVGWTINPVSEWRSKPIAYRIGVEIWPSHRSFTPFAVRHGPDSWNFRYLETAMRMADKLWPQSNK